MLNEPAWLEWVTRLAPAISAAATTGAVIISLALAVRAGRAQHNEQASQTTAWFSGRELATGRGDDGTMSVDVDINNASDQVIYDLVAQLVLVRPALKGPIGPAAKHLSSQYAARIGTIPPGRRTVSLRDPGAGMHKRLGIELAFQDAAGRYWFRSAQGALRQVRQHPADLYGLEHPVVWRR
jgi:hypothetical protein